MISLETPAQLFHALARGMMMSLETLAACALLRQRVEKLGVFAGMTLS